jgi:hypothetical protein
MENEAVIWDYYKPRQTHAWNMLVLSWRTLDQAEINVIDGFETEYYWENFIIRLWLYRTTIRTLTKIKSVSDEARTAIASFDAAFSVDGENHLKTLRDVVEHFDDYASGTGRGPAVRERDIDPWRKISKDRFARGKYSLERMKSYEAAIHAARQTR